MDFAVPADYIMKIQVNKKRDKYLDLAREPKNVMEHESDGDTNYIWSTQDGLQRFRKGTGRFGNRKTCRDHPKYSVTKISQNIGKRPEDLRRLLSLRLHWKLMVV